MFFNRKTSFEYNIRPLLPPPQPVPSFNFHPSASTFTNTNRLSLSNTWFHSHNSFLLSPNHAEYNSQQSEEGIRQSTFFYPQPITNPHSYLLNRTIDNCPNHLTGCKRTRWIKTGLKAKNNRELVSNLPRFQWPESYYDPPIHIHNRTPESLILGLLYKLMNVRTYTIDTESDRSTRQNPYSLPALIQIQAIHQETYSTVLLIEVQHLPHTSNSLLSSIQRLCRMIFSSSNKIMAWGDVLKELRPFEQFNLFDLSQVTNVLNLQDSFTCQWNRTHPHTVDCLARHQPLVDEPASEDVLVCLVNSDDLDDEFDSSTPTEDFNTCICPTELRPYKTKNAVWSLQKAIQFVFHEALDKSITFNFWSCGLDSCLQTWSTTCDKHSRINLINYAIYDLFAPTALFYYIEQNKISSDISPNSIQLNTIHSITSPELSSFLVITDSHGKFLPPVTVQSTYKLTIKSISGLQWVNPYNSRLCCKSLLTSSTFSTLLSTTRGLLFIIGSNSIRNLPASTILLQIEDIINLIRSKHPHLTNSTSISISNCFPCFKLSSQYPTCSSLLSNIHIYNEGLQTLSLLKQFSIVNFPISDEHIHFDGLHVRIEYLYILYETIQKYFDNISQTKSTSSRSKCRSAQAIKRRNKRRHEKLKTKQQHYTLVRSIARVWQLRQLKQYLKSKNIHHSRLPEIRHHKLRIQFNNLSQLEHAKQTLTDTDFDTSNYCSWISQNHS